MSRPRKLHKPIKLDFNSVLGAVALGTGTAKRAAKNAMKQAAKSVDAKGKKSEG